MKLDYKKIYSKMYKNLPTTVFIITFINFIIASLATSIILLFNSFGNGSAINIILALLIFPAGLIIGFVDAFLNYWITAIIISQPIVVADSLLKISEESAENTNNTSNNEKKTTQDQNEDFEYEPTEQTSHQSTYTPNTTTKKYYW